MELEQLVSFVRYQRGQKQGWDALDEVLTVVQESKERVNTAKKAVKVCEDKLNGFAQAEVKAFARVAEAEAQAKTSEAVAVKAKDVETTALSRKAAVEKALVDTSKLLDDLRNQVAAEQAALEVLYAQSKAVSSEKAKAESDLHTVLKQKAELKASL